MRQPVLAVFAAVLVTSHRNESFRAVESDQVAQSGNRLYQELQFDTNKT
jgi:hypothetical protein